MEDQLKDYAKELRTLIDKSNDAFEKQLNYISSGTLAISMIIVEKLVKDLKIASEKWLLILSWILLGATLISNLLSQIYTSKLHGRTLLEIDDDRYNFSSAKKRNRNINRWNFFSIILMLLGIIFQIIFLSKNI